MKKLSLLLLAGLFGLYANAQEFNPPQIVGSYPISETKANKQFSYVIDMIGAGYNNTFVHVKATILTNKWGYFSILANTKLKVGSASYQIRRWIVDKTKYNPGANIQYYSNSKHQTFECWLVFEKVPYDINSVEVQINDVSWASLPINNNESPLVLTDWTEESLRLHWQQYGFQEYEGIYEFAETSNPKWWGKSKPLLAIEREEDSYKVIYISDYGQSMHDWKEGHLKGEIRLTAVKDYYKVSWWADNGKINANMQVELKDGMFVLKSRESNERTIFVRMFPGVSKGSGASSSAPASPENSGGKIYTSQGSGVIIDANGIVVTNYHIVANRTSYEIIVKDGYSVKTYKTKLLAVDRVNDLALLQIDDAEFKAMPIQPFVIKSEICETGTNIFSMGYPLSQYMGEEVKVTDGIISSNTGYQGDVVTYQISAPIQPGSSGGPVFDNNGDLVGITNAGIRGAQSVGYAIKSTYLQLLIQSAPIKINVPTFNTISNLNLQEQIQQIAKFVVIVKAK